MKTVTRQEQKSCAGKPICCVWKKLERLKMLSEDAAIALVFVVIALFVGLLIWWVNPTGGDDDV
jgi:hypothetical protein